MNASKSYNIFIWKLKELYTTYFVKPDVIVPKCLFALSVYSFFPLSIVFETDYSHENESTAWGLR
jgi:hypothetical protein